MRLLRRGSEGHAAAEELAAMKPVPTRRLEELLRDRDGGVRLKAAYALALSSADRGPGMALLRTTLRDQDPRRRDEASSLLESLAQRGGLGPEDLFVLLSVSESAAITFAHLPAAMPVLVQATRNSCARMRQRACESLAWSTPTRETGLRIAVELAPVMRDSLWEVREAAARALGNLLMDPAERLRALAGPHASIQ